MLPADCCGAVFKSATSSRSLAIERVSHPYDTQTRYIAGSENTPQKRGRYMSLASEEMRNSQKKASWLPSSWGVRFAIAVIGSVIAWWWQIRWINGVPIPADSTTGGVILRSAPVFLCSLMGIIFPLWALLLLTKVLTPDRKWRNILSSILLLSFSAWIINALLKDWFGSEHGGSVRWLILIALIAAVLLYPLPIMRMKRKAVQLVTLGDYDGALRISRTWLRSKVYGRPFQGWIMSNAGRYSEALELLRDSAFDEEGRPLLKSLHLYFYAVTLMNEERYSEAQALLEAAVLVRQKTEDNFRFSLAECLLSQGKDTSLACELVELVMANRNRNTPSIQERTFLAQCMAIHAWALASCGRREEAKARLAEAFVESNSLSKDDLAALMLIKGEAWKALNDSETARLAFKQALALFPYGSIAMQARKALAKLGENVHE